MFSRILVAIDGSYYSRAALPTAIEMSRRFDAKLFILHVVEHDRGRAAAYSIESPAEQTRLVAGAVKEARAAGVKAKGELVDRAAGHVPFAIADAARDDEADLIVMGSRGLSDAAGMLLGSVSHSVIQLVDIPVMIVRAKKVQLKPAAEPEIAAARA